MNQYFVVSGDSFFVLFNKSSLLLSNASPDYTYIFPNFSSVYFGQLFVGYID